MERDLRTEAGAGAASGQMIWDAAAEAGLVVEPITEEGSDFFVADAPTEAELLKVLDEALSLSSKKLLIVVACPSLAVFYGLGIERGITLEKPVPAASIAPTIAWLGRSSPAFRCGSACSLQGDQWGSTSRCAKCANFLKPTLP